MTHPYKNLPDYAYWSRAISKVAPGEVDPVLEAPFVIDKTTKVATAGSCFAQHIARHLKANGFNYFVAENAHPLVPKEFLDEYNFGIFSARYGNIYTARQLLQLFDRAYGLFTPSESVWKLGENAWVDPLRPQIQPGGFSSELEVVEDRKKHLTAVREMFENLDIFVFTLGLTESWLSTRDGTVYPICPGVSGGNYSNKDYYFHNFSVNEIVEDFQSFAAKLFTVNSKAKIILTVSPVPLVATAENHHVLKSTTYSKSVLRVAAEEISKNNKNTVYFPSYEIITGNFSRGEYFAKDLRSVTENGVNHVMSLFLRHYAEVVPQTENIDLNNNDNRFNQKDYEAELSNLAKLNCEEVLYDEILNLGNIKK